MSERRKISQVSRMSFMRRVPFVFGASVRPPRSSRSERPVWRRKTSSRLGRCEGDRRRRAARRRRARGGGAGRPSRRGRRRAGRRRPRRSPRGRTAGARTASRTLLGGAVDAERDDVAGDLALELVGRALGHDPAVVDDRQPVGERVGLLEVVGGQEDRRPLRPEARGSRPTCRARACGSSPVVGSSRNRTAGRWTMPRPTSSRRFMPPE